jgi:hypothetical protein
MLVEAKEGKIKIQIQKYIRATIFGTKIAIYYN